MLCRKGPSSRPACQVAFGWHPGTRASEGPQPLTDKRAPLPLNVCAKCGSRPAPLPRRSLESAPGRGALSSPSNPGRCVSNGLSQSSCLSSQLLAGS